MRIAGDQVRQRSQDAKLIECLPADVELFGQGSPRLAKAEIAQVDIATEENVKKLGGTLGWGLVGGALLGPVGLLAGLLMGGRAKNVVFVVRFKDGRKLLASADSKTFTAIQAAAF